MFNFDSDSSTLLALVIAAVFLIFIFVKYVRIVPQNEAFVVERLGRYRGTLLSGFHLLLPFFDRVAYKHSLKERVIDVPPQTCITKDNIAVDVDGVLYLTVMDPRKASYGVDNYYFASIQIAQTTMRSVIGKLELDRTFGERESINADIIEAVDKASDPWGIKINRYEVRNITPPKSINEAMEQQMKAEREKRAEIARSEGERQAEINRAEGEKLAKINISEGEKQKLINEAQGQAERIRLVAEATALGLKAVAEAIGQPGGTDAVSLRIAESYLNEFGKLAKTNNSMIIPSTLSDVASIVAVGQQVLQANKK
ncbi:MAG: SPFH/Band 7/PHB domain protein [Candidatus Adiutrix sp.]|jgi:regulator of protease activity HflC (stomatin/prohibitin superfamily)|nr:SPFH/Band 7/PHB domain protein [Candidatus Adiutrix sp.]